MSNFLDELRDEILDTADDTPQMSRIRDALGMVDSLGESARRMLEIGIMQDELSKLGFGFEIHSNELKLYKINSMFNEKYYHVMFWTNGIAFRGEMVYFDSPTWQQEFLAKVKELIK